MRGNPHAAFDVAGAGNVAWSRWCDTRRRKGEPTGNTNFDLNRRVSPRPYCQGTGLACVSAGADFGRVCSHRVLGDLERVDIALGPPGTSLPA